MFCPKCGVKNADDARFCQGCGQKLSQTTASDAPEPPPAVPASITVTCPGCGIGLEVDGSLAGQTGACPSCGATVSIPASAPVAASEPPPPPPPPGPAASADRAPAPPAAVPASASADSTSAPKETPRKPAGEKKPKSALRSYLAKQARERPVTELKPVSKTFLWCLAVGPWVASILVGGLAAVAGSANPMDSAFLAFVASAFVLLILDQRAIKKSGRSGDGMLVYLSILFIGLPCIPIYLFTSGRDTKRGRAPGFVYLALLAVSVAVAALWNGRSESNGDAAPVGNRESRRSKLSVSAILDKANKAREDGSVVLCGFYVGMDKSDAEALVKHYRLKDDEYAVVGDPVWSIRFSLKGIRRITNGGNTEKELFQAVANQVGDFKGSRGEYSHETIDGYFVEMDREGVDMGKYPYDNAIKERARENTVAKSSSKDVQTLLKNMVRIPGTNFLMGRFEVTQAQWAAVMGNNPSVFPDADHPVEYVSWYDCQEFLKKLNASPEAKKSGLTFRLPTSEEWEYACCAGSTGDYCRLVDGTEITEETLGQVAWFGENSNGKTHPVGQKKPNAFGLFDMRGNVEEWTSTGDTVRVIRGGHWCNSARNFVSYPGVASNNLGYLGFRLCASGKAD